MAQKKKKQEIKSRYEKLKKLDAPPIVGTVGRVALAGILQSSGDYPRNAFVRSLHPFSLIPTPEIPEGENRSEYVRSYKATALDEVFRILGENGIVYRITLRSKAGKLFQIVSLDPPVDHSGPSVEDAVSALDAL